MTFVIEESIAYGIQAAVDAGLAKSQSSLVRDAVAEHLDTLRRRALEEGYAAAAQDPMFLHDMERVTRDFEPADEEVGGQ